MLLGTGSQQIMESEVLSEGHRPVRNNELECPVCSKTFDNLGQLNHHLDFDHGFDGDESKGGNGTSSGKFISQGEESLEADNKRVRHQNKLMIRNHWKKPSPEHQNCHVCKRPLNQINGCINCRKCGELFCKMDCRNVMRLNANAEYDPLNGRWVNCCYQCFIRRDGYNDYGSVVDLIDQFKTLRHKKNEDKKLMQLQLENRLVLLIDGISRILKKNGNGVFMSYRVSKEISLLERTVTAWKDDRAALNCPICSQSFGLTLRKHHCRLCGSIVCDNKTTNCSNQVPLAYLANAATDLPFKEFNPQTVDKDYSIRICSQCIHILYVGRKFRRDIEQPASILLARCESIYNLSQVISNIWPLLNSRLEEIENAQKQNASPNPALIAEATKLRKKLLRAVESYNILTRQISSMSPRNAAQKKIQQSFQIASSIFITEKILKLKSIPIISPRVNENRGSNESTPEVQKLSDIVFNDLTIKEIKVCREELMVLKEQKFLVESMIENAKKQRKFDEIAVLDRNLLELKGKIEEIQNRLGEQGFH